MKRIFALVLLLPAAGCMGSQGASPDARESAPREAAVAPQSPPRVRTPPASSAGTAAADHSSGESAGLPFTPRMRPDELAVGRPTETADGGAVAAEVKAPEASTAASAPVAPLVHDMGGADAAPVAAADPAKGTGVADPAKDADVAELSKGSGVANPPKAVVAADPAKGAGIADPAKGSGVADPERDAGVATSSAAGGAASGAAGTPAETGVQVAAAMPVVPEAPAKPAGIDAESLFEGDVVRYCAAMGDMGRYIGEARWRGEREKGAIAEATARAAREYGLPLDKRLSFSGKVYGRLVYRLDSGHSAAAFGAYAEFACLTVRGDKKIVPADRASEQRLNEGLSRCQAEAVTGDDLRACVFRRLTPVVDSRN